MRPVCVEIAEGSGGVVREEGWICEVVGRDPRPAGKEGKIVMRVLRVQGLGAMW